MKTEILVNIEELQEKRVAIVKDGKLFDYFIERPHDRTIVGNIYKARIDSVVPSVGAAFVDMGMEKNGFLYLSDYLEYLPEPIEGAVPKKPLEAKVGQEVLVQVVKEPYGTKGPRVTTHLSLAGRHIVLMPIDASVGVSRRIENDAERQRMYKILHELEVPESMGVIIRTAALGHQTSEIQRELKFLLKLWRRIKVTAQRKKPCSLIYEEYDVLLRVIRDSFTDDVARLIIDSKGEFMRARNFVRGFLPHLLRRMELYKKDIPLFEHKNIETEIDKIFHHKVFLKSGAYLVIEQTEGLVVIDVNSGHFKKKNLAQPEAIFLVNSEAAVEIARQLRLRDQGGIIVIDFIDMDREDHRRQVLHRLKEALKEDRAKTDVLGISKFGLVQLTRERVMRTVESLSYQDCPYCKGRGKIKSVSTMTIQVVRQLRNTLVRGRYLELNCMLHPDVAGYLQQHHNHSLQRLRSKYRTQIVVTSNPNLHFEEVHII